MFEERSCNRRQRNDNRELRTGSAKTAGDSVQHLLNIQSRDNGKDSACCDEGKEGMELQHDGTEHKDQHQMR